MPDSFQSSLLQDERPFSGEGGCQKCSTRHIQRFTSLGFGITGLLGYLIFYLSFSTGAPVPGHSPVPRRVLARPRLEALVSPSFRNFGAQPFLRARRSMGSHPF